MSFTYLELSHDSCDLVKYVNVLLHLKQNRLPGLRPSSPTALWIPGDPCMTHEWVNHLICPVTKQQLHLVGDELVSEDGSHRYSFKNGIATFLTPEERGRWADYHLSTYSPEPLPPHPYYVRFTDGWETMLDLGCGDGTMSASSAHKVRDIYCVDPGYTALRVLQKRGLPNMHPVNAFGEKLPFRDGFFDGIFNIFVIEHLANPLPMLSEIRRVVKPGGRLVIATDTAIYYKYLRPLLEWRRLGWRKGWRRWKPNDPTHINMMAPSDLRRWLRRAGFTIVEENIHFLTGRRLNLFLGWLPHSVWEACINTMFVFVCQRRS